MIIVGELLKSGKQIIINGKDYRRTAENKFTLVVLGAVDELERAKIIERMTRGKLHRLRTLPKKCRAACQEDKRDARSTGTKWPRCRGAYRAAHRLRGVRPIERNPSRIDDVENLCDPRDLLVWSHNVRRESRIR
jgi:hypothetical protein